MSEIEREQQPTGEEESGQVEDKNIRDEMATIMQDIEAGNSLTPELLGHFQELGGRLADMESLADGQTARLMLDFDCTALKFRAGFIEEAIDDLDDLIRNAREDNFDRKRDQIIEMAFDRRDEYEAALARQPKP